MANAEQTATALKYIEVSFIWIPILLCAAIAAVMYFYRLDSLREEMNVALEQRREEAAAV